VKPDTQDPAAGPTEETPPARRHRIGGRPTVAGVAGAILGLLPHLLHHVGWFAGTALIAGAGGTVLFAVVGLVLMVPMLLRLHRRFRWWGPSVALAGYALMFTLSTTLIGPALRSSVQEPAPQAPAHTEHTPGQGGHGHQPR
jgi:hypothetical protein